MATPRRLIGLGITWTTLPIIRPGRASRVIAVAAQLTIQGFNRLAFVRRVMTSGFNRLGRANRVIAVVIRVMTRGFNRLARASAVMAYRFKWMGRASRMNTSSIQMDEPGHPIDGCSHHNRAQPHPIEDEGHTIENPGCWVPFAPDIPAAPERNAESAAFWYRAGRMPNGGNPPSDARCRRLDYTMPPRPPALRRADRAAGLPKRP